jgi:hypothetical protein
MQLVIRVDLDKTNQPLPEIFRLIGSRAHTQETSDVPGVDSAGRIEDNRSRVIGEWEIEETGREERQHPLEPAFRAAATERYASPGQIEVDRFATVSMADDGAYVQGWLFVPQTAVKGEVESSPPKKVPQSVFPIRSAGTKAS